jgi:phosphoribosylglycinamide formyltransferase-1
LAEEVTALKPDLVVLAGFMRVLGAPLLERFPGRIINVHPALLPSFPGHDAPQDALDGGVRISGCTVHVVDAGVDTGPILAQAAVPVLVADTADTLHARIQVQEHALLPRVIHQIAIGAITLDPMTVTTRVSDPARSLSVPDA